MSHYEIAILGDPDEGRRACLQREITSVVADFGLSVGEEVAVTYGASVLSFDRDIHQATAAVFLAAAGDKIAAVDIQAAETLQRASVPIIPAVPDGLDFSASVPELLQSNNGIVIKDAEDYGRLAAAALECVGLLRRQRRVFISYRRIESREAALQLHDLLSARGFDAFLDTHDVKPGDPFQDILWHRLCDSDVVLMLDTPTYFERKWTRQELARALAKEIHILRVVWPEHSPTKMSDLADTIYLEQNELLNSTGPLKDATADQIVAAVERLRSRSIASRHMSMTGRLRSEVRKLGGVVEGAGAHRALGVEVAGKKFWVYPTVGIPTADLFNDIAVKAADARQGVPLLLYDNVGIRDGWMQHLAWLDTNITAVKAIKVNEAAYELAGLL